jgi:NAD(P)-dependent dehydrogenase (short-subunit alcohol dehydrogenase family)
MNVNSIWRALFDFPLRRTEAILNTMTQRILVVGGAGTIGAAVVAALKEQGAAVLIGGRREGSDVVIDINDGDSVTRALAPFRVESNRLDHIVCCTGDALFKPLAVSSRADYAQALNSKVLGQIDIVLQGIEAVKDSGSFTLTSGCLDKQYIPLSVGAGTANIAVNGFVRSAQSDLPRGLRINVVSPGLLTESIGAYGSYFTGFQTVDAKDVAFAYVRSVYGGITGKVLEVSPPKQWVEV